MSNGAILFFNSGADTTWIQKLKLNFIKKEFLLLDLYRDVHPSQAARTCSPWGFTVLSKAIYFGPSILA
jgi:hypothetical protein